MDGSCCNFALDRMYTFLEDTRRFGIYCVKVDFVLYGFVFFLVIYIKKTNRREVGFKLFSSTPDIAK